MSDTINDYWKLGGKYYKLICFAGFDATDLVSNGLRIRLSLWVFKPLNGELNVAYTSQFVTANMIEVSTEEATGVSDV